MDAHRRRRISRRVRRVVRGRMHVGPRDLGPREPRGAVADRAHRILRRRNPRDVSAVAAAAGDALMTANDARDMRNTRDATSASSTTSTAPNAPGLWVYLLVGVLFGVVITKAEVISWFRIQEMFRFQGFHMYGIFATAVPTAMLGV